MRVKSLQILAVVLLCVGFRSACPAQETTALPFRRPLVIYYSLTGTTRVLAEEAALRLGCDTLELKSRVDRCGFFKVNCVFDQLLDRDDDLEPVTCALDSYNPIILAAPVWIHRYASPMRTFIKQVSLKNKDVYAITANRGNYRLEDEQGIMRELASRSRYLKGYIAICTKDKQPQQLRNELNQELNQSDIFTRSISHVRQ